MRDSGRHSSVYSPSYPLCYIRFSSWTNSDDFTSTLRLHLYMHDASPRALPTSVSLSISQFHLDRQRLHTPMPDLFEPPLCTDLSRRTILCWIRKSMDQNNVASMVAPLFPFRLCVSRGRVGFYYQMEIACMLTTMVADAETCAHFVASERSQHAFIT